MPFEGQSVSLDVEEKPDGALAKRRDQLGVIVAHVADALAHRKSFHATGRKRFEQVGIILVGIEPPVVIDAWQDHGHPVMNRRDVAAIGSERIMAGRKPLDRDRFAGLALDTAEAIIAERGLAALNARELAAGTGIAVGTLYNMYGSLDRLVQVLNARTLDRLYDQLEAEAAREEKPEDRMVAMARAYIAFADEQPLVWRAVFDHQPAGEDGGADWYSASIERIANLAITILGPLFPPDQRRTARHVATIIWSGVHGICALAQGGNLRHVTHADPKRLAEDLVRGYLAGRRNPTATFS